MFSFNIQGFLKIIECWLTWQYEIQSAFRASSLSLDSVMFHWETRWTGKSELLWFHCGNSFIILKHESVQGLFSLFYDHKVTIMIYKMILSNFKCL